MKESGNVARAVAFVAPATAVIARRPKPAAEAIEDRAAGLIRIAKKIEPRELPKRTRNRKVEMIGFFGRENKLC
jgi:hypothetical protein